MKKQIVRNIDISFFINSPLPHSVGAKENPGKKILSRG
jgi:hypothetical protein